MRRARIPRPPSRAFFPLICHGFQRPFPRIVRGLWGANMVVKVQNRSRAPDTAASGLYRRPRLVMQAKRAEEIPAILANTKNYPTPVRFVGADYSQTRCVGGDGGTTVNLSRLGQIVEFGGDEVRVKAGFRIAALVRELAGDGQELPLTPEMGQMTVGAVAVTTLPQASQAQGPAQMSALVKELKLVTPQGKLMTVTERNADLMRVLSSSFGLLGVVHEAVLRVQPIVPVRIDHEVLTLKEFGARFAKIVASPAALRLHISPFHDRITVERRTPDETAATSRSGIWQIKKSVMRNVLPAFGSTVGSVLAAPGLRAAVLSGMHRALGGGSRDVMMYSHEWMRDMPKEAWKACHTYSLWAFPQADYPKLLDAYFAFCKSYYKQHRYRGNVVSGASRLHQDRGSLFSASYSGPMFTLEP